MSLRNLDAFILCGGKGKRLRSLVKNCPKPMAAVCGRPFLDIIIAYLRQSGIRRIILGIGYKAAAIRAYYNKKAGRDIIFSEERTPLGTGGGIKHAQALFRSSRFLVLNGDSFCKLDLDDFLHFHKAKKAVASVAVVRASEQKDCGVISVDNSGRITAFNEKIPAKKQTFVNAGIYLFEKDIFTMMPDKDCFSLEKDLLPRILNKKVYAYSTDRGFIDIGIPARYKMAEKLLSKENL